MLVLMQREGDAVIISLPDGRTVEVRLVKVERGRARIGYAADRDIPINRDAKARVPAEPPAEPAICGEDGPISALLLSNPECDEAIAALETYEWTGLTRSDIRLLFGTIWNCRGAVNRQTEPTRERVCPDSADGQHVLKQDGPFSVVYCDACGMNRGWRTQEPECSCGFSNNAEMNGHAPSCAVNRT